MTDNAIKEGWLLTVLQNIDRENEEKSLLARCFMYLIDEEITDGEQDEASSW